MNPSISVIIPACDRPTKFLLEAIESVRKQSLPALEIIVVNNGKTNIDKETLPPLVKCYNIKAYAGVSRARNFGAAMARGEFIAFLDDDDWWESNFLRNAYTQMKVQGVKVIYGRLDGWRDGDQWCHKYPSRNLTVDEILYRHTATGGQNLLLSKEIFFQVGGFDVALRMCEDRALAIEILLFGEKIGHADDATAVVRHHKGDRLRHHRARRLPYIFKYRKYMSTKFFVLSSLKYIRRIAKGKIFKTKPATSDRA